MMYGFGDDQNPYTESVDLLEDLVIEYITEMTHRAMEIGRTGRVQVEDIVFLGKNIFINYYNYLYYLSLLK
jgi:transcription initiation factor TFIID subunit 13